MKQIARLVVLGSMATWPCSAAVAQDYKPLTPSEVNVCQDLDICVDILLRHDPESFDYAVLAKDFQRFGASAMQRLLQLMNSDRELAVTRAQYILFDKNWQFTPPVQTQIAQAWPRGDIEIHAQIMTNISTPFMRDRIIATLSHEDEAVRAQSREVLMWMAFKDQSKGQKPFADVVLPSIAFSSLTQAALDDPTPEIIMLIGTFPPAQSKPVLTRFLLSEDSDIVTEAYTQLSYQSPDEALAEFKTALANIKTVKQALALSKFLQNQHVNREAKTKGGFYLRLAHDFVTDETLSPLVHMMAMDVIMNNAPLEDRLLPNTAQIDETFKTLITQSEASFVEYSTEFEKKVGENTVKFFSVLWDEALHRDVSPDTQAVYWKHDYSADNQFEDTLYTIIDYAALLVEYPEWKDAALPILRDGLTIDKDWRVQETAALALGLAQDKASETDLRHLANHHPILNVRAAARTALIGLETGQMDFKQGLQFEEKSAQFCDVDDFDFMEKARQLPFFEGGEVPDWSGKANYPANRAFLKTAFPTQSGWLAGYGVGEFGGGLLYYDNVSGAHEIISSDKTLAILPIKPTPLGSYATEFWAVHGFNYFGAYGHVSHIKLKDDMVEIRRHKTLPYAPNAINVLDDQSLDLGFLSHPPLRLLPNGELVVGCDGSTSTQVLQPSLPH